MSELGIFQGLEGRSERKEKKGKVSELRRFQGLGGRSEREGKGEGEIEMWDGDVGRVKWGCRKG